MLHVRKMCMDLACPLPVVTSGYINRHPAADRFLSFAPSGKPHVARPNPLRAPSAHPDTKLGAYRFAQFGPVTASYSYSSCNSRAENGKFGEVRPIEYLKRSLQQEGVLQHSHLHFSSKSSGRGRAQPRNKNEFENKCYVLQSLGNSTSCNTTLSQGKCWRGNDKTAFSSRLVRSHAMPTSVLWPLHRQQRNGRLSIKDASRVNVWNYFELNRARAVWSKDLRCVTRGWQHCAWPASLHFPPLARNSRLCAPACKFSISKNCMAVDLPNIHGVGSRKSSVRGIHLPGRLTDGSHSNLCLLGYVTAGSYAYPKDHRRHGNQETQKTTQTYSNAWSSLAVGR